MYPEVAFPHEMREAVLGSPSPTQEDVDPGLKRPVRLLELLSYVNGPSNSAGDSIRIFRNAGGYSCDGGNLSYKAASGEQEIVNVNLTSMMKGDTKSNPYVATGDIITVPEAAAVPMAYVIGNVRRAVPIELKNRTTLMQALAMAGGTTPRAKLSAVKISRQDPKTFEKTEIIVNVKDIGKDGNKDIVLQGNDIVDVPGPSGAKKFFSDILRVLAPTAGRAVPIL